LEVALVPSGAKPGNTEGMIDDLIELETNTRGRRHMILIRDI
jgi:hypothetical protein